MREESSPVHRGAEGSRPASGKRYVKYGRDSLTGFAESIPRNRCSLCFSRKKPFRFVTRPTGANGLLQKWPYCEECFREFENPADQAGSKQAGISSIKASD
jgi:hypothetical protein